MEEIIVFERRIISIRYYFIPILGIVFLVPLTQVSADVVWTEDWNDPPFDEWIIDAYSYEGMDGFQPNSSAEPFIVDGVFKMNAPADEFGEYWSGAQHNSTVAYGTWSFDWIVEPGVEHESYVNIFFIMVGFPTNFTGYSYIASQYTKGYVLNLQSGSKGPLSANSINFGVIGKSDNPQGKKTFSNPFTGSHHIDIIRSSDGLFNVFLDVTDPTNPPSPIISVFDNTIQTCDKFIFGAWIGDSAIDNISVSDSIDVSYITPTTTTTTTTARTPSFELELLVYSLLIYTILTRKRN